MAFCQPIYSSTGLVKSKAQFFVIFKKFRAGAAEARGGPFWTKNANDFNYQKNNKSMIQTSFKQSRIEKKIFEDSSYFIDSNIQLGQMLQNNKVKNILNNNNNASFSVTSMDDISFLNGNISNNNLFGSQNFSKNEIKNKSIKQINSNMAEVKELQNE